ncbi:MAG: hypothetical protein RLZZ292_226 [Bacteroidota bacterium]|jgi:alpha,alpha-trehalase
MSNFLIQSLSPLYEDVQQSGIFADSKFFPDCTPNSATRDILDLYKDLKKRPHFDLAAFVESSFTYPQGRTDTYHSENKAITQHLDDLWNFLKRKKSNPNVRHTLIPLPYSYIVPGGRFREIYYWDSYFTMLGLQVSKRVDIIQNMVDNFAHLIDTLGFIPNGNRTYYLGRSQPPFFSLMVGVLAEEKGEAVFEKYQTQLEKEYAFWMRGADSLSETTPTSRRVVRLSDGAILNRYWDEYDEPRPEAYKEDVETAEKANKTQGIYRHIRAAAESGWDFSSRWFAAATDLSTIETTDILPVDLNCLLLNLEETLLNIYKKTDNTEKITLFEEKITLRKKGIQTYFWNEEKGFYFDFHIIQAKHTSTYSLAAVYPLFFNVATEVQAQRVASCLENDFLKAGGLISTLNTTTQQWDAPNGWAPLQWMAYKGLKNYQHDTLANEIAQRWLALNEKTYLETGKMMEKYNVVLPDLKGGGGEYPNQDGFGWTNGVFLKLSNSKK